MKDKVICTVLIIVVSFAFGYIIAERIASRLWFDVGYRDCHKKLTGRTADILPEFPGHTETF